MRFFKYIIIYLFSFYSFALYSQETYYYQYLKSSSPTTQQGKDVRGGQFITFVKDKCYESDSEGFSVKNGVLVFQNTEKGISNYYGDAYWGKCYFRFNKDKTKLNVVCDDSTILVYERANPPYGVTTCSLIKKTDIQSTNHNNRYNYRNSIATSPIPYTSQPSGVNNETPNSSSSNSTHFEHSEYGYKECPQCRGTGICQTCNGKGWYIGGIGLESHPCPNCDSNHNGKCHTCHGTGKIYGRLN